MPKQITKIKMKDGNIEVRYLEVEGKVEKEVIFKCKEAARPEFDSAMSALVRDVYKILELPVDWFPQRMKITGVSFSHSEGTNVEGAVITGQVELTTSVSPFCFNTPHLPFEQYSETGNSPTMPEAAQKNLGDLKTEAMLYVEGSRAQLDLLHDES